VFVDVNGDGRYHLILNWSIGCTTVTRTGFGNVATVSPGDSDRAPKVVFRRRILLTALAPPFTQALRDGFWRNNLYRLISYPVKPV
jgi:hypothetical protein